MVSFLRADFRGAVDFLLVDFLLVVFRLTALRVLVFRLVVLRLTAFLLAAFLVVRGVETGMSGGRMLQGGLFIRRGGAVGGA
jgi:hypothetical protein